ncbi:MAG: RlmE family RNA methyltransferase [Pseudomonadota bacterium]
MSSRRGGPSGRNDLTVKLKSKKKRSGQSRRWLERQLNDPYVRKAKAAGYRSRAAFKLVEIDDRHKILFPGARAVDLGAAPGGWTQVAVKRVGAPDKGRVVGIDLLDMEPVAGADILAGDFLDQAIYDVLIDHLDGPVDIVLSDMAAATTGYRQTDHFRTTALFEAALDFAYHHLAPGGAFLGKVFRGGTETRILQGMKRAFETVRHVKPEASRAESVELYVLATGFRGVSDVEGGEDQVPV